jgi:glutamate synthase (NADPH/NADH) small chain
VGVTQIELLAKPPLTRSENNPWPQWPMILTASSSHEEGVDRKWAILTKEFLGNSAGQLTGMKVTDISWGVQSDGSMGFQEIAGTERVIECDLALLAIGFTGPQQKGVIEELRIETDTRGNIKANGYQTMREGIFAAGDARRGQSLVVWAISEGREAARAVDSWLMGASALESKDESQVKISQTH